MSHELRYRFLCIAALSSCLNPAFCCAQDSVPKVALPESNSRERTPQNRYVQALPGMWCVVDELQDYLDRVASKKNSFGGRLDKLGIQVMSLKEFWEDREAQSSRVVVERLASQQGHQILAGGFLEGNVRDRPLAWIAFYFVLSQKNGETYLCVFEVDNPNTALTPIRLHHIPGKIRDEDLLLLEMRPIAEKQKQQAAKKSQYVLVFKFLSKESMKEEH